MGPVLGLSWTPWASPGHFIRVQFFVMFFITFGTGFGTILGVIFGVAFQ